MAVSIIGAGALGRIVANILKLNHFVIDGFYDDDENKKGKKIDGIKVKGCVDDIYHTKNVTSLIVAVGDVSERKKIFEEFKQEGFSFVTAIHPSAIIAHSATIGEGVIIKDGAILEVGVKIGENSIIGNKAVICHDSIIGKHCRIAPGVTIAGHVKIEDECYLGVNVSVDRTLTIGKGSIIASGCTIWKNVPPHSIVKLPTPMKREDLI